MVCIGSQKTQLNNYKASRTEDSGEGGKKRACLPMKLHIRSKRHYEEANLQRISFIKGADIHTSMTYPACRTNIRDGNLYLGDAIRSRFFEFWSSFLPGSFLKTRLAIPRTLQMCLTDRNLQGRWRTALDNLKEIRCDVHTSELNHLRNQIRPWRTGQRI